MKKYKAAHGMHESDNPMNKPQFKHMSTASTQKQYPSKGKIESAGHEMKVNPPAILSKTKKKFGAKAAKKQKIAIMLSKARKGK